MASSSTELNVVPAKLDSVDLSHDDEVDFSSKFIVYDEANKQLLTIGLDQKKMMFVFIAMLAVFFFVLVAFGAIEVKDLEKLKDLFKDFKDIHEELAN